VILGGTYRFHRGFALCGGVNKISIGNNNFKLLLSYYTPFFAASSFNPQSIEISLNFNPKVRNSGN
jgi:hypothetical protein